MSATSPLSVRTDGGAETRSLIRYDPESTLLEAVESPPWSVETAAGTDVIWVTAHRSAAEISAAIGAHSSGEMPASVEILSMADSTIPVRGGNVTVRTIPPRGNLGRVTEAILNRIETSESTGHDVVVIIDDLTSVSERYAPRSIFRFLHLLTARGRAEGWTLQVGLDSTVLDDRVVEGLGVLFDEVI